LGDRPEDPLSRALEQCRRGFPLQRFWGDLSSCRVGVTVHSTSPLEVVRPFSVFVGRRAERRVWFTASLLQPWSSWTWLLKRPRRSRAEGIRFRMPRPSTPGLYTLPQGVTGDPSSAANVRVTVCGRRCPSHGVSFPTANTSAKEPYSPEISTSPARCVFRVPTSLDALLPFTPSGHLWSGRSWDFPFRAFFLPGVSRLLSVS